MRAEDIETLVSVGRPQVAADGSFAIFASSRPDITANRAVGQLWRVELPDGTPRRLTRGTADASPRLSPDGSRVAFLRGDAKGRPQIFVVAPSGGEPIQTTDAPAGVSELAWAPDGTRIAFVARIPERGRYGTVEGLDASAEAPRRVTGIRWHANGLGYLADRPAQIFVVDAPDLDAEPSYEPAAAVHPEGERAPQRQVVPAAARQLTSGETSYASIAFDASGAEILAIAGDIEHRAADLRTPVVAVPVDGSEIRTLLGTDSDLAVGDLAVAPDGAVFLLAESVGPEGVDFVAADVALWLLEDGDVRRVTAPDTIDLGESHLGFAGDDILVQHRTRGRSELARITRTGEITTLLDGDLEVTGHGAGGDRILAAVARPDSFGELVLVGQAALTTFGAAAQQAGVVLPKEVVITGRDGYPVHGWVATPEGEGPFPVILQIHGGPYASYGVHLFDETQVLVDAGYAVVYCNPRGSAGYGRDHGRAIRQAMGTVDFADVIDFFEGAVASDPRIDGARAGVMGGSYGGYLTAWVIAHDHRFRGAIVERGFLDPATFQGTSDIGTFFGDEYVGVSAEDIARQSPMAVVGRVRTPTLVLHSELDFRCPLEQATRYYSALKRAGVDAEMLIFPGENHELTRGGQPRHRMERFDAVLDWWSRHLPLNGDTE